MTQVVLERCITLVTRNLVPKPSGADLNWMFNLLDEEKMEWKPCGYRGTIRSQTFTTDSVD